MRSTQRPRAATLFTLLLAIVAVSACGEDGDDGPAAPTAPESQQIVSGGAGQGDLPALFDRDPCALISEQRIEELIGTPVTAIPSDGDAETQTPASCQWIANDNTLDPFEVPTGVNLALGDRDVYDFITSAGTDGGEEIGIGEESIFVPGQNGGGFSAAVAGSGSLNVSVGGGSSEEAAETGRVLLEEAIAALQD